MNNPLPTKNVNSLMTQEALGFLFFESVLGSFSWQNERSYRQMYKELLNFIFDLREIRFYNYIASSLNESVDNRTRLTL